MANGDDAAKKSQELIDANIKTICEPPTEVCGAYHQHIENEPPNLPIADGFTLVGG